jgi:hypothetical protein
MTDNPDSPDPRPGGEQPAEPTGRPAWSGEPMPSAPSSWQALKPGVIPLRPLRVGDILEGAIATMRRYPQFMLGVAFVVVTVTQLIALALTFPLLDDINRVVVLDVNTPSSELQSELWSVIGKSLAVAGVGALLALVAHVFLSGFLTLVVGTAVLGQRLTFGEIWQRVRPRLLPLLGLTLVYPLILVPSLLVVGGLAFVIGSVVVVLVIAYIVIAIWLGLMFSLATPALVLENAGVWQAFGRSWALVRGSWWRIFGITLLAGLIAVLCAVVISLPFGLSSGFPSASAEPVMPPASYLVWSTIGGIIASTLTEPFVAAVTALLYTDQRIRREGLADELATRAGLVPPGSGEPGAPPRG